jgi:uncharacterized protein DUF6817
MQVAQTNLQLYNQLLKRRLPADDLVLVHRAYELLTTLYPGYFQGDGKPFVAHGVGVASILAELAQPAEIMAVGLLHNVYGNADFGDGLNDRVTPARRKIVSRAVGQEIDELLVRFRELRIHPDAIDDARRALPRRDETDRRLILVDIADFLEKYVDLGVLYFGDSGWITDTADRIGGQVIEMARALDEPKLAEMLSEAFAEAAAHADRVPIEMRASGGRSYLELVLPRSCRLRPSLALRGRMRRLRQRLRVRTRLRGLRRTVAGHPSG